MSSGDAGAISTALVVDDEPPVRSTVKSILSRIGFRVIESDHGQHALSVLQANPCIDLLVTEAQPPGIDGKTLAESFMLKCPLGRTILLSDHPDVTEINIEGNGAWTFLPKQRLSDLLVDAVQAIGLGHPQRVILVVDDQAVVRNLVQLVLTKAGHVVMSAVDGQDALDISRGYSGSIDLVVTDVKMPRVTGPQLAEQLRRERPDTRILFMSGYGSDALRDFAHSPSFLPKPFAPKRLVDKVAELLKRSESPGARDEI